MEITKSFSLVRGHTFCHGPLDSSSVIVDGGAHKFEFAEEITRRFGSRVYTIEANPNFSTQCPQPDNHFCGALADKSGTIPLMLSNNLEASSIVARGDQASGSIDVSAISLADFVRLKSIRHIDLLKLDIEGAERDVLFSLDGSLLSRISQITCEFHDFAGFISKRDVERCSAHLRKHGFIRIKSSIRTNGDTLFLNQRLVTVPSVWERAVLLKYRRWRSRFL